MPEITRKSAQLLLPINSPAALEFIFERVFRRLRIRRGVPAFQIEYRPFSTMRSRIELRGNQASVRLSDLLQEAPLIVVEALAEILLAQLFRRRPSIEARECYMAYVCDPSVRERIHEARRRRGRLRLLPARGQHFDLEQVFADLNKKLFDGSLPDCRIGWSPNASRCVLGRYDPSHHTIAISRALDQPETPAEIIEYLVFHEMLHIQFPLKRLGHRRVIHSREFREAERKFPHYRRIRQQLKNLV